MVCALTDFKPKFKDYCQDYEEDDDAKNLIKKLTKEVNNPALNKGNIIGTLVLSVIPGGLVIFGNFYFSSWLNKLGWWSGLSIYFLGLGFLMIVSGIGTYIYFTQKRKFAVDRYNRHIIPFEYYRNLKK